MTEQDVRRIFELEEGQTFFRVGIGVVTIEDFLQIAGFKDCEPTKEAMLAFDGGVKGYKELIEQGNFDGS